MALKKKKKIPVTTDEEVPNQESVEAVMESRDADFSQLNGAGESEEDQDEGAGEQEGMETAEASEIQAQVDEHRQKYIRTLADFENYKKRVLKERSELLKYQGERIFVDLLEVVDNFELALAHAEADPGQLKEGVQLIYKMFHDFLKKWDVHAESGLGEAFDPNVHGAISRIPSADAPAGTILNELKKAYFYKDRLLRPAEVVVAVQPDVSSEEVSPAAEEGQEQDEQQKEAAPVSDAESDSEPQDQPESQEELSEEKSSDDTGS